MPIPYQDGARLDEFLKELKRATTGSPGTAWIGPGQSVRLVEFKRATPGLPGTGAGFLIVVDMLGLEETEQSMNSRVRRPPSADSLPLGEHLRRVLDPLGLQFIPKVEDGYLIITTKDCFVKDRSYEVTSKDSLDEEPRPDPYILYRDILR